MTLYLASTPRYITRRWLSRTTPEAATHTLPVDIRDDGENYTLTAFVPGLKAEDVNIQIIEDTLTIEGKFGNQDGEYLLNELPAGTFQRKLRLPTLLNADKTEASLNNGILILRIPRADAARPKNIQIATN